MGFSRSAAFTWVPLLSRLVLAAAFIPAGYDKILGEPEVYTGQDAVVLQQLGVGEAVTEAYTSVSQVPVYQDQPGSQPNRLRDRIRPRDDEAEAPAAAAAAPPPRPVVTTPPPQPQPVVVTPEPEPEPPPQPEPDPVKVEPGPGHDSNAIVANEVTPIRARRLYRVSLMLIDNNALFQKLKPDWLAWAAAGTELIGGGLLLLGLFSRLWGLGLAVTMGMAFYLTSLGPVMDVGPLALPLPIFNQVFTQLCLFVFAVCVAMTGAGRLSIDGLLFGGIDDDAEHLLHLS